MKALGAPVVPRPPARALESEDVLVPDRAFGEWVADSFLTAEGEWFNLDHAHLGRARVGWLWTSRPNGDSFRRVAGECRMVRLTGKPWRALETECRMREWFPWFEGLLPHFVVTLDAGLWTEASEASRLALVDHELYHAGQARDGYGCPRYDEDGNPVYALRPHDVEEFVGVVERFGATAGAGGTLDLVRAANRRPAFEGRFPGEAPLRCACGGIR